MAVRVFLDKDRLEKVDIKHSTLEEERLNIIGRVSNLLVLFVVTTDRDGKIRIISAGKAEHEEELSIMKTLTLNDVMNLPPLSEQEINDALNFVNTDFSDCPKQTPEDLAKFKPLKELRPDVYNALSELYKPTKKEIHMRE